MIIYCGSGPTGGFQAHARWVVTWAVSPALASVWLQISIIPEVFGGTRELLWVVLAQCDPGL